MKNAGLKSIEEAITRMMQGEVFYYNGGELRYDANLADNGESPFYIKSAIGPREPIKGYFSFFQHWQIKSSWIDDASPENPILCWVSDNDEDEKTGAYLVIGKWAGSKYETKGSYYKYATPVKPGECWQGDE